MGEMIGLLIGLILTLLIYSYVVGDNPLYRIAIHLLVGVSAAYAAVVVTRQVVLPVLQQFVQNPAAPDNFLWLFPLFLGALLLLKWLPTVGWLGNSTIAVLIGVGAAVALVGAVTGTLWPQITAVDGALFPGQGLVVAVLAVCTLLVFQFSGRRDGSGRWRRAGWQQGLAVVGRVVMTVTFGVLFASVLNTSLVLLASRIGYYLTELLPQ